TLKDEFPDISISKIRYLEDQGLLAPRRTQGGYRLFSEEDVERLETILRLQRDEFLPLRVIRQELASPAARDRKRRPAGLTGDEGPGSRISRPWPSWPGSCLSSFPGAPCAGLRQHNRVNLAEKVREVADWPQEGVGFKDVTPLLADAKALAYAIEQLSEWGAA